MSGAAVQTLAYVTGLWYGPGGHPDADLGMAITVGQAHDYRTRQDGAGVAADKREHGAARWTLISTGHKTAYLAAEAIGRAELAARGVPVPAPVAEDLSGPVDYGVRSGRTQTGEPNMANGPKKLSGLERLRAQREQK